MDVKAAWQMFVETGAPEMYLLYTQARKTEKPYVFEDSRPGPASYEIQ